MHLKSSLVNFLKIIVVQTIAATLFNQRQLLIFCSLFIFFVLKLKKTFAVTYETITLKML